MSLRATFPNYPALERAHGSVIRGMLEARPVPPPAGAPSGMFVSFPTGTHELVDRLSARLTGEIRLATPVAGLDAGGVIHTAGGARIETDAVILTVPPAQARALLRLAAPEAAAVLGALRVESSAVVALGFDAGQVRRPLDGYGFVVPKAEPARLLASTWSSTKLAGRAPEGSVLLRVFFGGPHHAADVHLADDRLIDLALLELRPLIGCVGGPTLSRVARWIDANPQYDVGHLDLLARLRALAPPWLRLAGCGYGGVGIPDCIRQGREAAADAALACVT
jgi:oxygen-dependent protoporphyrinogen oxidase